jgi:hypothetical protein
MGPCCRPRPTGHQEIVLNRALTHRGDPDLARHVGNAVVRNDSRGHRIVKEHRDSTRRIDLAVAAAMPFSVGSTTEPGPQLFAFDEADAYAPLAEGEGEGTAVWASPCRQRSRQPSRR